MARKKRTPKANPQAARRRILANAGVEATDELLKMPFDEFTAKFGEPEKKPRRTKARRRKISPERAAEFKRTSQKYVGMSVAELEALDYDELQEALQWRADARYEEEESRRTKTTKSPTTPKVVTVSPPESPKKGGTGKPKTRKKAKGKAKTVTVSTVMSGGTSTKTGLPTVSTPARKTTIGLSIPEPTPAGGYNPPSKPKAVSPDPPPPPQPKRKPANIFAGNKGSQVAALTAQVSEADSYVEKNIRQEAQAARSFLSGVRKRVRQIGKPKTKVTTGRQPTKAGPQMTRARIAKAGPQGTNVRIGPTRGPGYRKPRVSYPMPTVGGKTYFYYPPNMRKPEAPPKVGKSPFQKVINSGPASGAPYNVATDKGTSVASGIAVRKKTVGRELASLGTTRNPAINPMYSTGGRQRVRPIRMQSYFELPGLNTGGRSVTGNFIRRAGYAQMTPSKPAPRIGIPKTSPLSRDLPWTRQFSAAGGGMGGGVTMTGSAPMGAAPGTTSPPPTGRRRKRKPTAAGRPVNPARGARKTITVTRPAAPPSAVPPSSYSTPTPSPSQPKAMPGILAQSDAGTRVVRTGKREVSVYLPGQENRPALVTATSNKKSPSKTRLPTKSIDFEGFAKSLISDLEGPITERDTKRPSKKGTLKVADNVTRMEKAFPTPQARAKHRARLLAIGRSAYTPKTTGGKNNWTNTLKKKGFLGLAGGAVATGLGVAADVLMNPDTASAPPMPAQRKAYERQRRQKYARARAAGRKAFPAFRMYD